MKKNKPLTREQAHALVRPLSPAKSILPKVVKMNVEKFCLKCCHEIFYDTTEYHWCCECSAVRTIPDDEGMPVFEVIPSHWIDTQKMIDELRALRELREVCGMYCEQLPVEVHKALHAIPEIEKTHQHSVGSETGDPLTRDQMPWFRENMK